MRFFIFFVIFFGYKGTAFCGNMQFFLKKYAFSCKIFAQFKKR